MLLNDLRVKNAKPKLKPYKLTDGDGLFIFISTSGSKLWRFKYRLNDKENVYSIGRYPEISLSEARDERFRLRKLLIAGIDPNQKKKESKIEQIAKEEDSFSFVALEWYTRHSTRWVPRHSKRIKSWLDNDIIPLIGHILINEVRPTDILNIIREIEKRGAHDVARRVLNICSQVLRYGIAISKCSYDVSTGINQAMVSIKRQNFKCIDVNDFPELMRNIEKSSCNLLTKYALRLMALTFVRTTELRGAKWSEINFNSQEWRIPAERMKMSEVHIVPLSIQAINTLKSVRSLGYMSDYIFPNETNMQKVMSENTMLYALYDLGYRNKMTVHGFRQLASTILNEKGFNRDAIERQLSHSERNNVRRAYNHAQYLSDRRQMMQWWADHIDRFKHEW